MKRVWNERREFPGSISSKINHFLKLTKTHLKKFNISQHRIHVRKPWGKHRVHLWEYEENIYFTGKMLTARNWPNLDKVSLCAIYFWDLKSNPWITRKPISTSPTSIDLSIHDYRLESCKYLHLNFENKPISTSPMSIDLFIHNYRLESCRYLHLNFENKPIQRSPTLVKNKKNA